MNTRGPRIAGIDDAGRGSILGPLVIAGVSMVEEKLGYLAEMGVRDSKLLSPAGREELYSKITDLASQVSILKLSPKEIDEYVLKGKKYRRLNYLEAMATARVVDRLDADVIYVDASDVNPERFKEDILSMTEKKAKIISAHHADRLYPIVSAASIVAKVSRDHELRILTEEFGEMGSGYPADERTITFLRRWVREHGELPPFARKSWKTAAKLLNQRLNEVQHT